jgi:hypothetical protein
VLVKESASAQAFLFLHPVCPKKENFGEEKKTTQGAGDLGSQAGFARLD